MATQAAIGALRFIAWIVLILGLLAAGAVVAGAATGVPLIIGEQARAAVAALTVLTAFLWLMLGVLLWALLLVIAHVADCLTDIRASHMAHK